jgi:hypothetical protein
MAVLEEIPDEADAGAAAPDACGGAAPCAAEERSGDAAPPGDADADAVSGETGAEAEPEFHDAHEVRRCGVAVRIQSLTRAFALSALSE